MAKPRQMDPEGKRLAIVACAERLFATKGYTNTAMADIAKAADVAVGTLYRLFPDKPSLLAVLHAEMEARFIKALQDGWDRRLPPARRFGPMVDALFAEAEQLREIMPLYAMTRDMIGAADYQPGARMIAAIATLHAQAVADGAFWPLPSAIAGPLAHGLVEGAMRAWLARPTPEHLAQVKHALVAVFERGFAPPEALDER